MCSTKSLTIQTVYVVSMFLTTCSYIVQYCVIVYGRNLRLLSVLYSCQHQVRLIDVGCVQVVDVNQLLTLPKHFLQIPAQVIETFICGVRPCDEDVDWPEEVWVFYIHIIWFMFQTLPKSAKTKS